MCFHISQIWKFWSVLLEHFIKHKPLISEEWLHWWHYVGNITTFMLVVDCWLNWSCPLDTIFAPNIVLTQDKAYLWAKIRKKFNLWTPHVLPQRLKSRVFKMFSSWVTPKRSYRSDEKISKTVDFSLALRYYWCTFFHF